MDEINPGTLVVPRGLPGIDPLKLNIEWVLTVESRIQEIAFITPVKAPELISVFNKAFSELTEMVAKVQYELQVAKQGVEKARAICLIDRVPAILSEKGLTSSKSPMGSEDLRNAVLALDIDFNNALERVHQIQMLYTYLEGKKQAIDKAYMAVKAVSQDSSGYRHSPDLTVESYFKKGF